MPECLSCGAHVSEDYVRVFARDGEGVRCCPECPDTVRTDGTVREAKSHRPTANERVKRRRVGNA